MESENDGTIFLWHRLDVFENLSVFRAVRYHVLELCEQSVEDIRLIGEDLISEPLLSIGNEELTIKIISNSSTILHLSNHVLNSFELVRTLLIKVGSL